MIVFDAAAVHDGLDYPTCIAAVREAMIALSGGWTRQLPRSAMALGEGRAFAVMSGALATDGYFGGKLISVFGDPVHPGRTAHQGLVILFEGESGSPVCVADAEQITAIRTAAASAAATDALALPTARTAAILGCGLQAETHIRALSYVRPLSSVRVWGRSWLRTAAFADRMSLDMNLAVIPAATAQEAVADAEIICTVTAAHEPVLRGEWVAPGAHVNLVGSSGPDAVEGDDDLVRRARFFVESRASAQTGAAEFLRAKAAGLVDDGHLVAEIGEVYSGIIEGRSRPDAITLYKSIGHVVQDLAAIIRLYERAKAQRD